MWPQNSFITLTYDEKNLPDNGELQYSDFQQFMKKLRHIVGIFDWKTKQQWESTKLRFFVAGEYGELHGRPHYHLILFNYQFPDLKEHSQKKENVLYTSEWLTEIWGKGNATIGQVGYASAAYVAQYCFKKLEGKEHLESVDRETGEVTHKTAEFIRMSLRPGIGSMWYDKYKSDVFPHDRCISNGHAVKPPQYYTRKFKKENPNGYQDLIIKRHESAQEKVSDNTEQRLLVKEKVLKSKMQGRRRL